MGTQNRRLHAFDREIWNFKDVGLLDPSSHNSCTECRRLFYHRARNLFWKARKWQFAFEARVFFPRVCVFYRSQSAFFSFFFPWRPQKEMRRKRFSARFRLGKEGNLERARWRKEDRISDVFMAVLKEWFLESGGSRGKRKSHPIYNDILELKNYTQKKIPS